ncbi:MAG: hypothetical protein HS122_19670 [Opitutaceae bacterium]|nr:hypothetical protein [Opitutaceae bacterium]
MTKQNILLVDDRQHATLLAALRFYQAQGMGEPTNRTDAIHDIATNGDEVVSLDASGIDKLCERLQASSARPEVLASLKDEGMTIGECVTALAVPNDDPYVLAARQLVQGDNDTEIDDNTTTSVGEDGAWVLGWIWVNNEEAGSLPNTELLEAVLDHARAAIESGRAVQNAKTCLVQADWLAHLVVDFADELDGIGNEMVPGVPGPIAWLDKEGNEVRFMPSDALNQLRQLARLGGLPDELANQTERFCIRYGNKLDAILAHAQAA